MIIILIYLIFSYSFMLGRLIISYYNMPIETRKIALLLFAISPITFPLMLGMDNELKNKNP